jgi:hypothetical protein
MHPFWRVERAPKHSIHAATDFYFALIRFDMNVTGAIPNCLRKYQVDHLNNGGFPSHLLEIGKVSRVINLCRSVAIRVSWEIGENLLKEDFFNQLSDTLRVTKDGPYWNPEDHSKLINSTQILN